MLKVAYQLGVEVAVKEAAGEATAAKGISTLGKGTWGGLKSFFTAAKVREALRNIAATKEPGIKMMPGYGARFPPTVEALTVLSDKGVKGIDKAINLLSEAVRPDVSTAVRKQLRSALVPYMAMAGIGGAALGGPALAKKVFPGLRGD